MAIAASIVQQDSTEHPTNFITFHEPEMQYGWRTWVAVVHVEIAGEQRPYSVKAAADVSLLLVKWIKDAEQAASLTH